MDKSVWMWARLSPAAPGSGFLPLLLCRRSGKLLPFPQTHLTRLLGNHVGDGRARNAGKRLSKSESDLHISQYLTFQTSRFVTSFVFFLSFLQRQNRLFYPTLSASSSGGGVYTEIRGSAAEFMAEQAVERALSVGLAGREEWLTWFYDYYYYWLVQASTTSWSKCRK